MECLLADLMPLLPMLDFELELELFVLGEKPPILYFQGIKLFLCVFYNPIQLHTHLPDLICKLLPHLFYFSIFLLDGFLLHADHPLQI